MSLAGRSALLLRIASGVTLLFAAGQAMGASESWSPPGPTDVLQLMRAFQFDVMDDARTYWHFYVGAIFRTREAAETFVKEDPFILEGLVASIRIREWNDAMLE